jgi:hypothetical protein
MGRKWGSLHECCVEEIVCPWFVHISKGLKNVKSIRMLIQLHSYQAT